MKTKTKAKRKRASRGRPMLDPRGKAEFAGIRLGPTHREILDGLARARGVSKSVIVRELLESVK